MITLALPAFAALEGAGAIAYFFVLTGVELSIAGPASALVYIFSVLIGHVLFKEAVPVIHLAGLGLIVCGVVLVGAKV